jgi:hypothetical protein
LDELVHRYGLPHRIITDLGSNFNNHQFWSTARTAGSTSDMSQLPILGPMDKLSVPMGWYSTLSRSDCTTLLTQKEASGSRNYPMRSGDYILIPPSQRDNHHTSWSTAPRQSSSPMSYGIHQLLTQNLHLAPSTQQAEQAGFTREEITRRASQFSLKINKIQSS